MNSAKYQQANSLETQIDSGSKNNVDISIKQDKARYPLCITWTHLPLFTMMVPSIGHTGMCGSDGVIYDFAGPYYIEKDNFSFGTT